MISNLREIRADGKVIEESMRFQDMLALNWAPCLVTGVEWQADSAPIRIVHEPGMAAKVLPGRRFVVLLKNEARGTEDCSVHIMNSDGTVRHKLSNTQYVGGLINAAEMGTFGWLEDAPELGPDAFRIAFEPRRNRSMFWLDIDAVSGNVLGNVQKR